MNEWYVILQGYGSSWTPVAIVLGRTDALAQFTTDIPVTPEEARQIRAYGARPPAIGAGVGLVGHYLKGQRVPDRKLVRVPEPRL